MLRLSAYKRGGMNSAKSTSGWMCRRDMAGTKQRIAPADEQQRHRNRDEAG